MGHPVVILGIIFKTINNTIILALFYRLIEIKDKKVPRKLFMHIFVTDGEIFLYMGHQDQDREKVGQMSLFD